MAVEVAMALDTATQAAAEMVAEVEAAEVEATAQVAVMETAAVATALAATVVVAKESGVMTAVAVMVLLAMPKES